MPRRYAISTRLFHSQRLARAHLQEVAAHGFEAIELFATRGHFDYHERAAIDALGLWLQEAALELHSVHAPIVEGIIDGRWGRPLTNASAREAHRTRAVQEARLALAIARHVPFGHLVLHLGRTDAEDAHDNRLEAARRSIEELCEDARAVNVRLALEVIPNALSGADALVRLIEDVLDLPDVGICLDFGHGFLMGDLVDAIEAASGYLATTHVHDNHGTRDDHLMPFDGAIEWSSALMAVQKIGYEGAFVLELAESSAPTRVLAAASRTRGRLEQVLGE
jgi:sugar phosphate isomerase/epimerase